MAKNALAPIRDFIGTSYKMLKYYDPNDNVDYYRLGSYLLMNMVMSKNHKRRGGASYDSFRIR